MIPNCILFAVIFSVVSVSVTSAGILDDILNSATGMLQDRDTENEDGYLDTEQLLDRFGYSWEPHYVTTPDGYILRLTRMTGRKGGPQVNASSPLVLLMPGLCVSDTPNILNGPGKAIGTCLTDEGFDVWLANHRGGRYSSNHTTMNASDPEFWAFDSYDTYMLDTPAIIDYVLDYTNKSKLHYVGLSFGGIEINYVLTVKPEYNDKIKSLFYVASAMSLKNTKSSLVKLITSSANPFKHLYHQLTYPILSYTHESVAQIYTTFKNPVLYNINLQISELSFGPTTPSVNKRRFGTYAAHMLNGCPLSIYAEATQLFNNEDFRFFDGGKQYNLARYGTEEPLLVNLSQITAPKVLFYGSNDILVDAKDVFETAAQMKNVVKIIRVKDYSHGMIGFADNMKTSINDHIAKYIKLFD